MTSDADRQRLLQIARAALAAHVTGAPVPVPAPAGAGARLAGAFVTLHKHGQLRGCIGHVEATEPLARVIARCAIAAGTSDPRFPAVGRAELDAMDIEVSVLGPLERITSAGDIDIGRHGLVVESGWQRGLLLPQVAAEWRWDPETFLRQTCVKAGLPPDAWRSGAQVFRFEAEVFGDRGASEGSSDS